MPHESFSVVMMSNSTVRFRASSRMFFRERSCIEFQFESSILSTQKYCWARGAAWGTLKGE